MKGLLVFNLINQEKRVIERFKFICDILDDKIPIQCTDCYFFGHRLPITYTEIDNDTYTVEIIVADRTIFNDIKTIYS